MTAFRVGASVCFVRVDLSAEELIRRDGPKLVSGSDEMDLEMLDGSLKDKVGWR